MQTEKPPAIDPEMESLTKSMSDSMTPDLAKALEYVKNNRRPLRDDPPSFTTSSSDWIGHAQSV